MTRTMDSENIDALSLSTPARLDIAAEDYNKFGGQAVG